MSRSVQTDTEKKIAEIREGYKSERDDNFTYKKEIVEQDIRFLLSELDRAEKELELFDQRGETIERQLNIIEQLQEENRKLREELAKEKYANSIIEMDRDNWISDYSELLKELQSAQQEIERLLEENEGRKKIIEAYIRIEHDLAEDAERYLQQRDKLIEGLRWYANPKHWYGDETFCPPEGISTEEDCGQRARNILKEIGVTLND